mmetsp:Transcript_3874/g.6836  ORF Transcript_3874/g.6836 Transcript_3874/m.6836 type:complete len:111 (+) Transcript_3874:1039-1371(+)
MTDTVVSGSPITLENVASFSLFELRQEMERRHMPLPNRISHETLMRCLISRLVEEQAEKERVRCQELDNERDALKERLAREKAERKAAAVARSQRRQAQALQAIPKVNES